MADIQTTENVIKDLIAVGENITKVSDRYGMSRATVRKMLREHPDIVAKYKGIAPNLVEARTVQYESLTDLSLRAIEKILRAPLFEEVPTEHGIRKVFNANLAKVQKELAEGLLESQGIKKVKKGSGIQVNTQVVNQDSRSQSREIEADDQSVLTMLQDCRVEDGEVVNPSLEYHDVRPIQKDD